MPSDEYIGQWLLKAIIVQPSEVIFGEQARSGTTEVILLCHTAVGRPDRQIFRVEDA
jgi:hypothetical protein